MICTAAEIRASGAIGIVFLLLLGTDAWAGQSAEVLFPRGRVESVEISPAGDWIVASATFDRMEGLLVQNTSTSEITTVYASRLGLGRLAWVGRSALLVESAVLGGWRTMVIRFRLDGGRVEFEQEWIAVGGRLVDPLPLIDGEIIWHSRERGRSAVRRVNVDELAAHGKRGTRTSVLGERLSLLDGDIGRWITDSDGLPRVARRDEEDQSFLLYRGEDGDDFEEIYRYDPEDEESAIELQALSVDRRHLVVSAYNGHDTKGLYEFDPVARAFGKTLFRHDETDVVGVVIDPITRELVAAVYEEAGDARYHYFSSYGKYILDELAAAFPKDEVVVVGSTADRLNTVFWVSAATNPGAYYFYDSRSKRSTLIADLGPGIDRSTLADVDGIVVRSEDGTEIEAFLTMPRTIEDGGVPLVVMPHGGPIDVRDRRTYDPLVQYLASWGFAVLQPNYRGSSGYGRKFLESAKKEWAKGIEDDIDAAVAYAMARPEIDGDRLCIVGGSYGGFSAIASVIRHKTRYRCSVSINGVSDIPLLYDSSDMADSERVMDFYEDYVGDLETEREKLIAVSPAYHVDEIETPILLVYGTADRRVDPDHSHRMRLMLETFGKQHEAMEVEHMLHSPSRDEWVDVARRLRRYLTRYLRPGEPFEPDPGGESEPPSTETPG